MTTRKKRSRSDKQALEFAEATKYHGDERALAPVSFAIDAGQSVALLGHNGSGKSTLLSLAAGLLAPTEGTVRVFGTLAGEQAARAAVSYVPDQPVLYEDLTVREHLDYLTRLHGSDPRAHDVDRLVEQLGLSHRIDNLPSTFSRGLRQKAALAIGLCRPFALLLVDEPFAGLDPAGQAAFLDLLNDTRNQNGAVLVATHDHRAVSRFDRALVLDDGELVYDGRPADLPTHLKPIAT